MKRGKVMHTVIRNRVFRPLLLGAVLVASYPISGVADMAIGKVTSVDSKYGTIAIDGINFEIDSRKSEITSRIKQFKSGQAVQFESNGNKLIRIEAISGGVDFPVLASPPASLKRGSVKP
jgi:hypothetical protein